MPFINPETCNKIFQISCALPYSRLWCWEQRDYGVKPTLHPALHYSNRFSEEIHVAIYSILNFANITNSVE